VTGVKDMSGNAQTAPSTTTFTTGTGDDLTPPTVTTVSPANGAAAVATTTTIQLTFSKRIDPLTVTATDFTVIPSGGAAIAGTIAVAANGLTATFTPSAALQASTLYYIEATTGITDMEGQPLAASTTSFTTQ
jgi:Bacterial Ig-like domain